MAKKITRISIVIALGFLLTFVSSLTAANNNDIYDDMTAENYIGSTTVTWGDSLLDWGAAVGIDSDENVVIVGYSETEVGYNLTVVKYDSYFNYLWNTTWEIDKLDKPQDLVIDGSDNIIITGSIWQGPTKNVFILKYDADGILLWNETWVTNTFDEPYGIDVNSGDEIYITGTTTSTTGTVFILKYDADGILLWNSTYGDYDQAVAYDIKVNNTDIYLTGYIEYPYMKQLFLGKFDSVGTNVWAETLGGPGTEDIGKGLIVTGEDVYVVGQTESLANYLTDTIILKYNSTGHIQWYRLRDEEEGNSIALRPDGNILIAGDIGYSDGLFAVEYSPTGFLRWNTIWSSGGLDNCMGIVAGQVNFYLVGQSNSFGSGDFDMLLITFQSVVTVTPPPETVTVPGDTDVNITLNLIGQALLWTGFALLLLILILLIIFFVLCMIRSGERVVTKTKKEKPKTIVKEVPVTVYKDRVITKEGPPGPEKKPEDDPLTLESDIDDAPEVGPATHRQFKKLKIKKVKDFMSQTPEEIVEQLNKNGYTRLKVEDIKRMQTEAQLMLDIGPLRVHDAVILFKVGIKSRSALAKSDQDELWEKVQGVVDDTHVRKFLRWSNLEPTYEEMADWIAFGKEALKSTD